MMLRNFRNLTIAYLCMFVNIWGYWTKLEPFYWVVSLLLHIVLCGNPRLLRVVNDVRIRIGINEEYIRVPSLVENIRAYLIQNKNPFPLF